MTTPGPDGLPGLRLVCDRCGASSEIGVDLTAFELVWRFAREAGWRGPARPVGPHYCPSCAGRPG
jgi:hypothetical protein